MLSKIKEGIILGFGVAIGMMLFDISLRILALLIGLVLTLGATLQG